MKEAIIMTREEYKEFCDNYQELKYKRDILEYMLDEAQCRIETLWSALNRPAIEESVNKADKEYYDWCDEIARKYEKIEEEEWITSRAKFYNNGIYDFCQKEDVPEEEAYAHRQYYDEVNEYDDMEYYVAKTEGWSDLPYFRGDHSWILYFAESDALERYKENKNVAGKGSMYWHIWITFVNMCQESKCLGNGCYEFYR